MAREGKGLLVDEGAVSSDGENAFDGVAADELVGDKACHDPFPGHVTGTVTILPRYCKSNISSSYPTYIKYQCGGFHNFKRIKLIKIYYLNEINVLLYI